MRKLHSTVINRKMLRLFPVPPSFFLGARVLKRFDQKWYQGTVNDVVQDEETTLWHVSYSDFDGEEMDIQQLASHIYSHPLLDPTESLDRRHHRWVV